MDCNKNVPENSYNKHTKSHDNEKANQNMSRNKKQKVTHLGDENISIGLGSNNNFNDDNESSSFDGPLYDTFDDMIFTTHNDDGYSKAYYIFDLNDSDFRVVDKKNDQIHSIFKKT